MYSIVLMVAMTHGAATPMTGFENGADFNQARYGNHLRTDNQRFGRRGRRRGGCCGCSGGGYGGCSGGWGYGGCSGGWGGGCCGYSGGGWGYGGCSGGWGYGGCTGGYASSGFYGGCTGGVAAYGEGMGGWGGSMGAPAMPGGPGGNMGAPGGPGRAPMPGPAGGGNPYRYNYGSGYEEPGFGAPPAGGVGAPPAGGNPTPEPLNPPAGSQTRSEAPATFTVHLPANAKLLIDNRPTTSASTTRTFVTPPLPEDRSFTYTLKAQLDEAGKPVIQTQQITVRGGQNTDVTLQFPEQRLTRK